ncbi:DUF2794 domain-containing protein [Methylocystis sp. SC2]|uniref:DUF2794 domain-containing protein n=1 Tax=Methylocystis sp. (strain SC2) TaxID=187303 RepID=UPI00027AEB6F|nr:DUF2794 domain-containing protein [Methylocystis sp. SC2]CCJ06267.1 Conserved hypothetical protein [Methylocystis sp. SC2]
MAESETTEPSRVRPALVVVNGASPDAASGARGDKRAPVSFSRLELNVIFNLYGAKVAQGEWRDYAIDFTPAKAVFSIFRRASEAPLYRIEKDPALARRQGAYSVIAATGLVLRRGHDLARVVRVLDRALRLVGAE